MLDTALVKELVQTIGPVGTFLVIGSWWLISKRTNGKDHDLLIRIDTRQEAFVEERNHFKDVYQEDVKELKAGIKHVDEQLDEHMKNHV